MVFEESSLLDETPAKREEESAVEHDQEAEVPADYQEDGVVDQKQDADNPPFSAEYLDLYKMAVDMADRISARRGTANAFFVTVNTALLAFLGIAELNAVWPVALGGVVIAVTWFLLIKSYRDLNRAKFEIINSAEHILPIKVFYDEWQIVKKDKPESLLPKDWRYWATYYLEFTIVEMIVPIVFALLYLAVLFS